MVSDKCRSGTEWHRPCSSKAVVCYVSTSCARVPFPWVTTGVDSYRAFSFPRNQVECAHVCACVHVCVCVCVCAITYVSAHTCCMYVYLTTVKLMHLDILANTERGIFVNHDINVRICSISIVCFNKIVEQL